MELENLNLVELAKLRASIDAQIETRRVTDLDKLRADILSLCGERGFTLQEVLTSFRKNTVAKKAQPAISFIRGAAYQNPKDPSQLWYGFGSRPTWLRQYLQDGGDVTKLVISTPEAAPAATPEPTAAPAKAPAKKPAPKKPAAKKPAAKKA